MSRVLLPPEPVGAPVSTVVFVDGIIMRCGKHRAFFRLACGHEGVTKVRPKVGDRRLCRRCKAFRTLRAYHEVQRLAAMNLTEREVEYLAGRLAEQRDRKDGGK